MDDHRIHTIVPRLRFPDFLNDGEWEVKKFDDTFSFLPNNTLSRSELNYEKGIVQNIHYGDVLIKYGECVDVKKDELPFITDNSVAQKYQQAKLQNGDVVIADTAEDETVGKCSEVIGITDEFVVSGLHTMPIRPNNPFAQPYLGYYLNSESYRNQLRPLMQGVKVTSLSKSAIGKTTIVYPKNIEEQHKISSCLLELDEMLSATNGKLEQLKAYKKGLMQKLFPAKGKKLPELRFKEFEKDGEWETYKVSDLFKITRGYVLPASETKATPDNIYKYPVYSSQTANNGLMGYYFKALYKNAITWTTDGANAGTVRFREGDFYCTNVCGVLIDDKGYSNLCVAEILGMVSKKYVSLVGNPKLMNNVMGEIPICIPSLPEQRTISALLSSMDISISAYEEKLKALRQYKKGLMQQMFPSSK